MSAAGRYDSSNQVCPTCSGPAVWSERWDSYACLACQKWVEAECGCPPEDGCPFRGRPSTPPTEEPTHRDPVLRQGW